jgi:cell division transport system permease protein
MAKTGKASARRGKPSYAMAVIGITLVLFIVGILGWIVLSSKQLEKNLKEQLELTAYLKENLRQKEQDSLMTYIASRPYVKSYKYVDKDAALAEWKRTGGEDFMQFLDSNVLSTSINLNLKSDYVSEDSIKLVRADLLRLSYVNDISYGQDVVINMKLINQVTIGLIILAAVMALIAIILIDNTIKLAMFSNRFLIKTMQMVGATRGFISRPMNLRAIANGAIAAVVAIALMYGAIFAAETFIPQMKAIQNTPLLLAIFGGMLVLGILISYVSTQLSVNKYSKKSLDDLY